MAFNTVPRSARSEETVRSEFVPKGITQRLGGYSPKRAEMDQEAKIVSKLPADLKDARFGYLKLGDRQWAFALTNADGDPEKDDGALVIDSNGDGDLTNDPACEWTTTRAGEKVSFRGKGYVDLGDDRLGLIQLYRFDPNDKARVALKNTVLFYEDYGTEYALELDGKSFSTLVAGTLNPSRPLGVDRDGNGRISSRYEMLKIGKPFNFTGTTYIIDHVDGKLSLKKSEEAVEQSPLPPDLRLGKKSIPFSASAMAGGSIEFPKSFEGKLVMLDFWATWCGPCIAEIPNMKQAYADWHEEGFEILGISLDRPDVKDKVVEFLKDREIDWPQVFEPDAPRPISDDYDVTGIPFVLLVDGSTGEILGTSRELRGPKLSNYIGKMLESRKK
jgi:thiol-disulfide isomerase/thioredoxin